MERKGLWPEWPQSIYPTAPKVFDPIHVRRIFSLPLALKQQDSMADHISSAASPSSIPFGATTPQWQHGGGRGQNDARRRTSSIPSTDRFCSAGQRLEIKVRALENHKVAFTHSKLP